VCGDDENNDSSLFRGVQDEVSCDSASSSGPFCGKTCEIIVEEGKFLVDCWPSNEYTGND
jgi:hypothetical protein